MNKPDATLLAAASGKSLPATVRLILISVPELILTVHWLFPGLLFSTWIKPGLFPSPSAAQLWAGLLPRTTTSKWGGLLTLAPLCKHTNSTGPWRVLTVKSIDSTRTSDSKFQKGWEQNTIPNCGPAGSAPGGSA